MTDSPTRLRGPALRDRLYASRAAVRDALLARPSVALRDAIAAADAEVSVAMLKAIEIYERLALNEPAPEPPGYDVARTTPRVGLPPPRRIPSARPVPPT